MASKINFDRSAIPYVLTRQDVAHLLAEQENLREQLAQLTEKARQS